MVQNYPLKKCKKSNKNKKENSKKKSAAYTAGQYKRALICSKLKVVYT